VLIARYSLAVIFGVLLAACGLLPEQVDETRGWSVQKLYSEAKSELNNYNYEQAIKYYEKLEARYPYGRYAQQAQIEIAYAYYKNNDAAQAMAATERFIKLHPNHPNVDYAYYLKGLISFNDDLGWLGYFSGQDMSERDSKAARESFDAFKDVATRFPDSKYTPDSIDRMMDDVENWGGCDILVNNAGIQHTVPLAEATRDVWDAILAVNLTGAFHTMRRALPR